MERFIQIMYGLRIFISPFLVGLVLAAIIYLNRDDIVGQVGAALSILIGTASGIGFARWASRTRGTVAFMSKGDETPDMNKSE